MHSIKSIFAVMCILTAVGASAADLHGVAAVNVTSDTAANAKNMAFDEATRQIVVDALRQYVDMDALNNAVANAKGSELSNLIMSSSIDGEQTSDTTYSANISMIIDADAARVWLDGLEIKHWLPDSEKQNMFDVVVTVSDKIDDWAQLNKIAAAEKLDLGTKNIHGNTIKLQLPVSVRGTFTIAVRGAGWRYSDKDGVLHIWK